MNQRAVWRLIKIYQAMKRRNAPQAAAIVRPHIRTGKKMHLPI